MRALLHVYAPVFRDPAAPTFLALCGVCALLALSTYFGG
jgi:hypothetical protein